MRSMLILLLLLLAPPALAVDGVLEINQTCAVSTGCFAGDTAGFPVTLNGSAGRSYRLTSDLVVPDANTTAVEDTVGFNWSIDLNGFQIAPPDCDDPGCKPESNGVGRGIRGTNTVSMTNGIVAGMNLTGVELGEGSQVSNLRVRWNANEGIRVGNSSSVVGNIVFGNGLGIASKSGSNISDNVLRQNTAGGIACELACTISENAVIDSGFVGISTAASSTVSGNTIRTSNSTGTWGLELLDPNIPYRDNTITNGVGASQLGSVTGGLNAGGNVCNGSLTCP